MGLFEELLAKEQDKRKYAKLNAEYSRATITKPNNPIGDAIQQYVAYVKPRLANPLQTIANEAQRFTQMNPQELTSEVANSLNGGIAGTFIGKNAKTWNKAMAETAQQLEDKGVHPEQIWKETGTFKGADGKWRQEIDDSLSEVRNLPIKQSWPDFSRDIQLPSNSTAKQFKDYKKQISAKEDEYNSLNRTIRPVEDIYSHPTIYNEYPDLLNLSAHHRPEIGLTGSYGRGKIEFGDVSNPEGVKSLFGHELQHAIQQREGFAMGGSPDVYGWEQSKKTIPKVASAIELHDLAKELGTDIESAAKYYESQGLPNPLMDSEVAWFVKHETYDNLKSGLNNLRLSANTDPYEAYRALAGEAESRLTQARMKMNATERAASYPPSMYDVPMDKQIIRLDEDTAPSYKDPFPDTTSTF